MDENDNLQEETNNEINDTQEINSESIDIEENVDPNQEEFDNLYDEIEKQFYNRPYLEDAYQKLITLNSQISNETYRLHYNPVKINFVNESLKTIRSYLQDLKDNKDDVTKLRGLLVSYNDIIEKEKNNLLGSVYNYISKENTNLARMINEKYQAKFDEIIDSLQNHLFISGYFYRDFVEKLIHINNIIFDEEQKKKNLALIEQTKLNCHLIEEYEKYSSLSNFVEEKDIEIIDMIIFHLNNNKEQLFPPVYIFFKEEMDKIDRSSIVKRSDQEIIDALIEDIESNYSSHIFIFYRLKKLIELNEKIEDPTQKEKNNLFIKKVQYNNELSEKFDKDVSYARDHTDQISKYVDYYTKIIEKNKHILFPKFIDNINIELRILKYIEKEKTTIKEQNEDTSTIAKTNNSGNEDDDIKRFNTIMRYLNKDLYVVSVYKDTINELQAINNRITDKHIHRKNAAFIEKVEKSYGLYRRFLIESEDCNVTKKNDCENLLYSFKGTIYKLDNEGYLLKPISEYLTKRMEQLKRILMSLEDTSSFRR